MKIQQEFIERVNAYLSNKEDKQYCVFYLDFNDFQIVNHYCGFDNGNALLEEMYQWLFNLPDSIIVERIYADHFLVLSEYHNELYKCAEEMQDKLNEFILLNVALYQPCQIIITCGACALDRKQGVEETLENANYARKLAKRRLDGEVVLYDITMRQNAMLEMEKEKILMNALKNKEFTFFLQPKVNLKTGEIVGCEALARRVNERNEVIEPIDFLVFMELNGTIVELDYQILDKVCAYLRNRLDNGKKVIRTSVNLSRLHINDMDSAKKLYEITKRYDISPDIIDFELTETILLNDFSGVKQLIADLEAYGFSISIDDFGSGYAGINIWQELDFETLKLDKRFLSDDVELRERNNAILPNIIDTAKRMKIDVICEGVENKEQCEYLAKIGCDQVQGYYFSRPLPADDFYRTYDNREGYYPVNFSFTRPDIVTHDDSVTKQLNRSLIRNIGMIIILMLFLAGSVTGLLHLSRTTTMRQFTKMMEENLAAYSITQKNEINARINEIQTTLDAISLLFEQHNDQDHVNAFIATLNETQEEGYIFTYVSDEEYNTALSQGLITQAGQDNIEQLKQMGKGDYLITDIMHSAQLDENYYVSVATPVIINGQYIGSLRGMMNAEELISTSEFVGVSEEIIDSVLVDHEGNIIAVNNEEKGDNLYTSLIEDGVDADLVRNVEKNISSLNETGEYRLFTDEDKPIYLSAVTLDLNDWHLIVCVEATTVSNHYHEVLFNTSMYILIIGAVILLITLVIVYLLYRIQNKSNKEEYRYTLLEQFNDTVLFDYDVAMDTLYFTSNVRNLIMCHDYEQGNFLKNIDARYIHPADTDTMKLLLKGQLPEEDPFLRVRLVRSDEGDYFWCLLQYQYHYDKENKITHVIGKITDIDNQKNKEDYLLDIAEKDGLTRLKNKMTVENEIKSRLVTSEKGILFIIDIDDFKGCNDMYGHPFGDEVLLTLADALRMSFRSSDLLGRIGGDEMLVYLANITNREAARMKAEELKECFAGLLENRGLHNVTVCIGISLYPKDGEDFETLYENADRALYQAKRKGKNQYAIYEKEQ